MEGRSPAAARTGYHGRQEQMSPDWLKPAAVGCSGVFGSVLSELPVGIVFVRGNSGLRPLVCVTPRAKQLEVRGIV